MEKNQSFWEKRVEKHMERRLERRIYGGIYGFFHTLCLFLCGVAIAAAFGYAVMLLWNWLVPGITGWQSVSYWQAIGLLVLCRIFFGKVGCAHWLKKGHYGSRHHHNPIREKWLNMSDEERREFLKHRGFDGSFCRDFFKGPKPENQT